MYACVCVLGACVCYHLGVTCKIPAWCPLIYIIIILIYCVLELSVGFLNTTRYADVMNELYRSKGDTAKPGL